MAKPSNIRRFRVNPVEVLILSAVCALFFRSVYSLVYIPHDFQALKISTAVLAPPAENRAPASVSQSFINLDVKCTSNADQDTSAAKVRLTGSLCGTISPSENNKLVKTAVSNGANKFNATVFTDLNSGKFSTDYIPLNSGKNPIHLEFSYRDGKTVSQDLNIIRN